MMTNSRKKSYSVHVAETRRFWGVVNVSAESPGEARRVAAAEFEPDWVESVTVDCATTILAENGEPLEAAEK